MPKKASRKEIICAFASKIYKELSCKEVVEKGLASDFAIVSILIMTHPLRLLCYLDLLLEIISTAQS